MLVVIDTNVAVVAEGLSDIADQACIDVCMDRLREVIESGDLLLDEDDAIMEEYAKALGHAGQPGVGRAFVKWAWNYRFDDVRIKRIAIKECDDGGWRRFEAFPDRNDLKSFDKNDQKFVAVACACGEAPPILHATDRGWWNHKVALTAAGLTIESLCPQHAPKNRR